MFSLKWLLFDTRWQGVALVIAFGIDGCWSRVWLRVLVLPTKRACELEEGANSDALAAWVAVEGGGV